MQLNVTGHHVDVTTSMKVYVEKKLDRIVRHSDRVIDVHCVLTVEKLRHKAEATVIMSGATVHADATDGNMYAAIDALVDKLADQIEDASKLADTVLPRVPLPRAGAVPALASASWSPGTGAFGSIVNVRAPPSA